MTTQGEFGSPAREERMLRVGMVLAGCNYLSMCLIHVPVLARRSQVLSLQQYFPKVFVVSHFHYSDVIMDAMASQITSLTIVYSTVYTGADQRKHKSTASLAFVWGIHRWPVNSPHKWPVTRKMFPVDDVIMRGWKQYSLNDILCLKLDDGSASVMWRRHLISNTKFTTDASPWEQHPRIYNLTKTDLGSTPPWFPFDMKRGMRKIPLYPKRRFYYDNMLSF